MTGPKTQNEHGADGFGDGGVFEPIAIVGFAFRFPGGAVSEETLWDMMVNKQNVSTEFPPDRLNIDAFYDPDPKKHSMQPTACKTKQSDC